MGSLKDGFSMVCSCRVGQAHAIVGKVREKYEKSTRNVREKYEKST